MANKPQPPAVTVPLKLQGKSVYLAGNFYHQDGNLRSLITFEGGTIVDELTDKTDFMVLGYSGVANPQKKAAKLNTQGAAIQVLTVDQFHQQIRPTPDEAVQLLLGGPAGIERWNRHCRDINHYHGSLVARSQAGKAAYLHGIDFSNADLSNANLAELVDQCDFTGANLSACALYLANCQLANANLDGVVGLTLVGCTATDVDFSRVAARDVRIGSSDLAGSPFANLEGRHLDFEKCNLRGADFRGLKTPLSLQYRQCDLTGAKFVGATLEQADFAKSDLSGADFTNANLKLARFTGATVDGADFTGATMIGADIAGVDFSKARGFDPAQVEVTGGAGAAVKEFLKVAKNSQRVSTTTAITQGTQVVVLSLNLWSNTGYCNDSVGLHIYTGQGPNSQTPQALWTTLATKWHDATPDLASVTVKATKAPIPNKELKQLAVRAWCELFGIEPPSDEDMKKAARSTKAQKKEKADEWLAILRTGKNGVKQWNESSAALGKMLNNVADIDLSNARLIEIKLHGMDWPKVNLSGADLCKAEIHSCKFPEGDLTGTILRGAQIRSCSLVEANLENADLCAIEVWGTSFKRAKCKGAKFADASLNSADFCGTDLTGADLEGADFARASYDEKTRWPKGFSPTLEMVWKGPGTSPAAHKLVQSTKPKGKLDIDQFMKRLEELTDAGKLAKALSMLKADRFRLYAQVNSDHFVGVVKSQSDAGLVYSCRLNADGAYACCTQNLNVCGGLRGSLCKHLLVLIVGLTKNGELEPNLIDTWIRLSKTNKPALDKDAMSETFLRYKGAEAGEVDWRPTETIPEDFYTM
ncbi:MAG: pentapeptide repeat-containing protein [Planctomycetes bacterium]|nr:pentapeptide repeat-containing protein [Planctomycetota bacterium]